MHNARVEMRTRWKITTKTMILMKVETFHEITIEFDFCWNDSTTYFLTNEKIFSTIFLKRFSFFQMIEKMRWLFRLKSTFDKCDLFRNQQTLSETLDFEISFISSRVCELWRNWSFRFVVNYSKSILHRWLFRKRWRLDWRLKSDFADNWSFLSAQFITCSTDLRFLTLRWSCSSKSVLIAWRLHSAREFREW